MNTAHINANVIRKSVHGIYNGTKENPLRFFDVETQIVDCWDNFESSDRTGLLTVPDSILINDRSKQSPHKNGAFIQRWRTIARLMPHQIDAPGKLSKVSGDLDDPLGIDLCLISIPHHEQSVSVLTVDFTIPWDLVHRFFLRPNKNSDKLIYAFLLDLLDRNLFDLIIPYLGLFEIKKFSPCGTDVNSERPCSLTLGVLVSGKPNNNIVRGTFLMKRKS